MNAAILLCALGGAAGMGLLLTAGRPRPRGGLAGRLGLTEVAQRRPLVDRLFGNLVEGWLQRRDTASAVIHRLRQAGMYGRAGALYPDERVFYAYKLAAAALVALLSAGMGAFAASILEISANSALLWAVGGAAAGFLLPDLDLQAQLQRRDDQLLADMATALDRLANFLVGGQPLPQAINCLAARPGGAFVQELALVAGSYNVGVNLSTALQELLTLNGDLAVLVPFVNLCRAGQHMGGGVSASLRELARELRTELKQRIETRGSRNAVLMVIPAFLAVLATLAVLTAPGFIRIMAEFASGAF